jgi:putative peptidoglycan lipid II flippase
VNRRRDPHDDPYANERPATRGRRSPYTTEDDLATTSGWYEPEAATIEMPILDEMMLQQAPGPRGFTQQAPQRPRSRPGQPPVPIGPPGAPIPPLPPGAEAGDGDRPETRAPGEKEEPPSSAKSSRIVATAIFLSSCAGLVRESVIGYFLGVGHAADAFKAALRIPNMLQNLLGEGVLSASFIPVYARLLDDGDEEEAGRLAGAIAGILLTVSGVFSIMGVLFAPQITKVLVTGFNPATFDLTVRLVRIMFPSMGFLVLSAWCLGILNSHRKFFLSYIASVLWNATQITFLVAAGLTDRSEVAMATALAWGVLVGGLAQLMLQLRPVLALTGRIKLSLDHRRTTVRSVLKRFGPVVVGKGVVQVIVYIDLWLASFLASGAVSSLSFATLLYLLPIGMFGLGVAAAELPDLSRVSVHDAETRRIFRHRLEDGMARISFYVMPIATMYIVVGDVIVAVIFQHGKFGWQNTWGVWLTLAMFAIGLPATTSSRLLQNSLFALDDPKTPPRLSVMRVATSSIISLALMFPLDRLTIQGNGITGWDRMWSFGPLPGFERNSGELVHLGILAFAISATIAAIIEYRMLARAVAWRIGRTRMAGRWLNPIAGSCAVSAAVAFALATALPNSLPSLIMAPLVLGPAGLVYLGMTRTLGVPEARALTAKIEPYLRRG